ncbi:MAG: hypothetical protein WAU78_00895 [Roseiarcus sp.]
MSVVVKTVEIRVRARVSPWLTAREVSEEVRTLIDDPNRALYHGPRRGPNNEPSSIRATSVTARALRRRPA